MKVVFCWSSITGYMASCWRELQQYSDVEIFVLAFHAATEYSFDDQIMRGVPYRLLDQKERNDPRLIESIVIQQAPDVIVFGGWFHRPYRELAFRPVASSACRVMGMDTVWKGTFRQHLAPWLLHSYLNRMDLIIVAGERSWQYARRLGIKPERIVKGLYGIDGTLWFDIGKKRQHTTWPKSFLFLGRYVEEKAIDVLVPAYLQYRQSVADPWPLICCGGGPFDQLLKDVPGIEDRGFVQPAELPNVLQATGVFLLPSRSDAWPLALVEAAAAGMPVVCTSVCGSAVEVVRDGYNGLVTPAGNSEVFAAAMSTVHSSYEELPVWGERSAQLAQPYAAELWAQRWRRQLGALYKQ